MDVIITNHDSLLTFISPVRIEALSGNGFIVFDSLKWTGRLTDSTVVDHAEWAALGVDGQSRDWVGVNIIDEFNSGGPALAPGSDAVAELHFTVLGGPAVVEVHPVNSGFVPELGYPVQFDYIADQFDLHWFAGYYIKLDADGSGDLNCDGVVTASDIILLVNLVFKS